MKSRSAVRLVLTALLAPFGAVVAQEVRPDSVAIARARVAMTADLRNLGTAQEAFFSDRSTYTAARTDLAQSYRTSDGVSVALLTASNTSHSAIATHRDTPGLVCAFSAGTQNPISLDRADEGRVVCRLPDGTLWRYTRPARLD
jgi:hypothetical protein